jgi:hypothetical protein
MSGFVILSTNEQDCQKALAKPVCVHPFSVMRALKTCPVFAPGPER